LATVDIVILSDYVAANISHEWLSVQCTSCLLQCRHIYWTMLTVWTSAESTVPVVYCPLHHEVQTVVYGA